MPTGSKEVSKDEWYNAGGFKNSRCWRRQTSDGVWHYYIILD